MKTWPNKFQVLSRKISRSPLWWRRNVCRQNIFRPKGLAPKSESSSLCLTPSSSLFQTQEISDENKSIIWFLIKQVRPGMDLSKVVLPTFILEPRDQFDKPFFTSSWMLHTNKLERLLESFLLSSKFYTTAPGACTIKLHDRNLQIFVIS